MHSDIIKEVIPNLLVILRIIIALLFGFYFYILLKDDLKAKLISQYNKQKEKSYNKTKRNARKREEYNERQKALYALGVKYYVNENISPYDYTMIRIGLSIGLSFISLLYIPIIAPAAAIIGYMVLPYYDKERNKRDNQQMLEDFRTVYGLVILQISNGVHISKVMYECAISVKNKRLSKALMEFSMDIENFSLISEACDRLCMKFDNPYIDTFSKSILQAQDTGNVLQLFEDMQKKLDGINEALFIKKEDNMKNICFLFTTLIFLAGGIMIVYIVGSQLMGEGSFMIF